jgi:hypothetical protein
LNHGHREADSENKMKTKVLKGKQAARKREQPWALQHCTQPLARSKKKERSKNKKMEKTSQDPGERDWIRIWESACQSGRAKSVHAAAEKTPAHSGKKMLPTRPFTLVVKKYPAAGTVEGVGPRAEH